MEYYEGEWSGGKRSGWGRMYYKDGSIYEGQWLEDQHSGQGMLRLSRFQQLLHLRHFLELCLDLLHPILS